MMIILQKRGVVSLVRDYQHLIAMSIAVMMTITMAVTIIRVTDGVRGVDLMSLYAIVFTYIAGWLTTRQRSEVWHRGRRISLIGVLSVAYMTVAHRL